MNKLKKYLVLLFLTLILFSCIRESEEDCPSQYTVTVTVIDKNYFNIESIPQLTRQDETLSFKSYVGNLSYQLQNIRTREILRQSSVETVMHQEVQHTFTLTDVPKGEYILSVWGNIPTGEELGIILHNNQQEYSDIYLASDIVDLSAGSGHLSLGMQRTKGKLVLILKNLPSSVIGVYEEIGSLYTAVDHSLQYSGNTLVKKEFSLTPLMETYLAPTVQQQNSRLKINLLTNTENPLTSSFITLPELDVNLKRNEITAVQLDYNDELEKMEIWININSQWTIVHRFDIDDLYIE